MPPGGKRIGFFPARDRDDSGARRRHNEPSPTPESARNASKSTSGFDSRVYTSRQASCFQDEALDSKNPSMVIAFVERFLPSHPESVDLKACWNVLVRSGTPDQVRMFEDLVDQYGKR